jgi:arylsulfate sulfotransferase
MSHKWYSVFIYLLLITPILLIFNSCSDSGLKYRVETKVNPYRISPLTAIININADKPCRASIKVLGESPVEQSFEEFENKLRVPVVGLYPGRTNKVLLTLDFDAGQVIDTIKIITDTLPNYFPGIQINKIDRSQMEPGFHLCDMHYAQNGKFHSRPMIFDDQGQVRWYLDLSFF